MNKQINNHLKDSTKSVLHLPPQGLSRAKDILPFLPFGRTTLHEWSKDGRFPASIKLSPTMVAWCNGAVLDWLNDLNRDALTSNLQRGQKDAD